MRTRVIGLTGGIASGKSTVGRMLQEVGASLVDADEVARHVTRAGGEGLRAVVDAFGPACLTAEGELDRAWLGNLVFREPAARARLNAITHPLIVAESHRRFAELGEAGVPIIVYEAALLVENGSHERLDGLIVVTAPETLQVARLRRRDGLSTAEAQRRISAQLPLRDKVAVADYVIDGAAPLPQTRAQVREVWDAIQAGGPRRQGER